MSPRDRFLDSLNNLRNVSRETFILAERGDGSPFDQNEGTVLRSARIKERISI